MSDTIRRLSIPFLALALAVGLMAYGIQTSGMAVKMTTAADSDMPMLSSCADCNDDHGTPAACFVLCGGLAAVLPLLPAIGTTVSLSAPAVQALSVAGHHGPPDPYPPRPTILG